jgi:hypothetical protein
VWKYHACGFLGLENPLDRRVWFSYFLSLRNGSHLPTTQCACANFVDFATQRNGRRGRENDLLHDTVLYFSVADGIEVVFRRCSLERLTELDSKIGLFKFETHDYDGYLSTCVTDGCNSGNTLHVNLIVGFLGLIATFLYSRVANHWI